MKLLPKFQVVEIDKDRPFRQTKYRVVFDYEEVTLDDGRTIKRKVEGSGKLVSENITTHGGYLVYFPNGNSIRVEDDAQMERLGLNKQGGFVDGDTGDDVPMDANGNIDFRAMLAKMSNIKMEKTGSEDEMDIFADVPERADVADLER